MDGASAIDPTVALIIAVGGFLGATLTPMVVAFINSRGSKAAPEQDAVPWSQYAGLLEQYAEANDTNDMLNRELAYIRSERDKEHAARQDAEQRLKDAGL